MPPGSYLVISHPASDVATAQMATSMRAYNDQAAVPLTARSHAEVAGFLAGLDLIDPGLVQLHRWRAGTGDPGTGRDLPNYGAVARKPARYLSPNRNTCLGDKYLLGSWLEAELLRLLRGDREHERNSGRPAQGR
jgi:hypothetical protein